MSFRSQYAPSETDEQQQPRSLDYTSNQRLHDQSMTDLYGSQNPLNMSLNTSFGSGYYGPHHSARSYSVQDIASLPGLGQHNSSAYPSAGGPYNPYNQFGHPMPGTPGLGPAAAMASMPHNPANGSYPHQAHAMSGLNAGYVDPAYTRWVEQYRQWYNYVQNVNRERMRMLQPVSERARLTPHRYPHRHTRVSFGGANQLVCAKGTIVTIQQIDPSLIDLGEEIQVTTWPGPLVKRETKKDEVLEYIRTREGILKHDPNPESYFKSHERKQIWSLLSMLVRQNGTLSGADLSELLLANNENEFESPDESDEIAKLRRYLTLGQRKTALEFAQKSGLWGHVTSLVLFSSPIPNSTPESLAVQFSKVVSKFMNTTLSREDPLFILYRSLLTRIQSSASPASVTSNNSNNNSKQQQQQQQVTTDTLQQFAILLANDCDVNPCVKDYSRASELLKLMVGIKNNVTQHLVNLANLDLEEQDVASEKSVKDGTGMGSGIEYNYSDELVFINEIWEFSRDQTEFIERLVPLKTLLASRLFDFGHLNQASRYCYAIRQYFTYYYLYFPGKKIVDSNIDWDAVIDFVTDLECRIYGFDVTKGAKDQSSITEKKKTTLAAAAMAIETENENTTTEDAVSQDIDVDEDDGTDADDMETDSEADRQAVEKAIAFQSRHPTHKSHQVGNRRESQMSSTSAATSGERSRTPSTTAPSTSANHHPNLKHPQAVGTRNRTISFESHPPTSPAKGTFAASPPLPPSPQSIQSNINSKAATPPAVATFQPLSLNEGTSISTHNNNFFIPAAASNETEAIPEFNFVSSSIPSQPSASDSLNFDESRDDNSRRMSNTPFVHNSTAVPGLTSPAQFPNAFSPIVPSGKEQFSDQMNGGLNASGKSQNSFYSQLPPQSQSQTQPNFNLQHQQQQQQQHNSSIAGPGNDSIGRESPLGSQDKSAVGNTTAHNASWFNSIIRAVAPKRPKQAVLPDDTDKRIYWDPELKRYIDKDNPNDGQLLDSMRSGPPRGSMISATSMPSLSSIPPSTGGAPLPNGGPSTNNFTFINGPNRRKPQYVDVWQQQQQKSKTQN